MHRINSSLKSIKYLHTRILASSVSLLLCLPISSYAQFNVGTGASVNVGNGSINMNCSDVNVAGSMQLSTGQLQTVTDISVSPGALLQGDSGQIFYSGDWINLGQFQAGQSSANLNDDCNTGNSLMIGDSDFYQFSVVTQSPSRELTVAEGSQQGFLGDLQLVGTGQGRIDLHSSTDNSPAYFVLGDNATQQVANVDVRDNDASRGAHIAPVEPSTIGSTRGANVVNWFIDHVIPVVPIPTLSAWSLIILIFGMLAVGINSSRRRIAAKGPK